jgi:mannose-6-phosphate isomerase-like protein (cupin superfamily)
MRRTRPRIVSPLQTWFEDAAAVARFRRGCLARAPAVREPRDDAWRSIAPNFAAAVDMAASGLPFQVVADRRYDRSADPRRVREALGTGATVYLPQVHQVLPRLARIMVALRAALLGPAREECSFLFLVAGDGRPGMGLHHDGEVDSFWIQLEGRRTVTVGPPVARGTPADLDDGTARGRGWWTRDLGPGTLLYMPPRTPHGVVCRERSLAISLTWKTRRRRPRAGTRAWAEGLVEWDVASGRVADRPRPSADRLWTQAPAVAGPLDRARRRFTVWTPQGALTLPASARALARRLVEMPSFTRDARTAPDPVLARLGEYGLVADEDLPLRIVPDDVRALDGWRFA